MQDKNTLIPLSTIFMRSFSGFVAGIAGSIVLGIVIILSWSIVGDTLMGTGIEENEFGIAVDGNPTHPLFLSLVTLALFGATLTTNLVFTFLTTVTEEKYSLRATTLTQVFFGNLAILFLSLPVYLIFSGLFGPEGIAVAGVFHAIITIIFTSFVLEILNSPKTILITLYGILFALILFLFFGSMLIKANASVLAFLTLPLLGCFMGGGTGLSEVFYNWIYRLYGVDFLNLKTRFGKDYGKE